MSVVLVLGVIAFGAFVGVLSAVFGVGGGIVMVPFMVLVLEETQHVAEGTSLLVIVATAAAGVFALRNSGHVSYRPALWLGLGGVVGSFLGALLALELSAALLEDIFAVLVVTMGLRLLFTSFRRRD